LVASGFSLYPDKCAMTDDSNLTPAMRQYMEAKKQAPADAVLLFRMGDFYELFFDDAKRGAALMDIVLTRRAGVPMCGVPHHAVRGYVARMISQGVNVAIAEQMEDPKLAKGLVKRAVTQVITPGTILDDQILSAGKSNFLVAIYNGKREHYGLALLDVSTGDFRATELDGSNALETELHRLYPAECLLPANLLQTWQQAETLPDCPTNMVWTPVEDWLFDHETCRDALCRQFGVLSLDGFGCRERDAAVSAAGAVLNYAQNNLRCNASHLTALQMYHTDSFMVLDRISQRNLELVEPLFAEARNATLLSVLDQTVTPMGSRLMREWILRPLRNCAGIEQRQDAVEALLGDPLLLNELREILAAVRDVERIITRLNIGSANARDLLLLRQAVAAVPDIRQLLAELGVELITHLRQQLIELPQLVELIGSAIVDEPPLTLKEGGLFRGGYNADLDLLRSAATDGKSWIAALQAQEQERTGIKSLKIRFNKVFGYYIEITRSNLAMVPDDYMRKQTLANAERYITPELKQVESKVLGSEEKSKALEYELFQSLREQIVADTGQIQQIARAVASVDVLASLALIAGRNRYQRPQICSEPVLEICDGRHPVLDYLMTTEMFVPNDTLLDTEQNQLAILTGPNMAGKSTYIRQVALLTLMAQMGSFIPVRSARIGLTDRIFTRVGAADDISRGQSTFMVEMVETANILHNATAASLIILDEIGRGTSTFDGLSLAWAVAEYLHDQPAVKARTLFATHYHELTELALTKAGVRNYNVAVREYGDKIIFLRKIIAGSADKSYGIQVARLAGLPKAVINRAREVLTNLEADAINDVGAPRLARSQSRKRSGGAAGKANKSNEQQLELFEW